MIKLVFELFDRRLHAFQNGLPHAWDGDQFSGAVLWAKRVVTLQPGNQPEVVLIGKHSPPYHVPQTLPEVRRAIQPEDLISRFLISVRRKEVKPYGYQDHRPGRLAFRFRACAGGSVLLLLLSLLDLLLLLLLRRSRVRPQSFSAG